MYQRERDVPENILHVTKFHGNFCRIPNFKACRLNYSFSTVFFYLSLVFVFLVIFKATTRYKCIMVIDYMDTIWDIMRVVCIRWLKLNKSKSNENK